MNENPVTQDEAQENHDAWWNSLTNEDKEKLYNEMAQSEVEHIDNK